MQRQQTETTDNKSANAMTGSRDLSSYSDEAIALGLIDGPPFNSIEAALAYKNGEEVTHYSDAALERMKRGILPTGCNMIRDNN